MFYRSVAQPGRALALGARSRRFNSCHSDQRYIHRMAKKFDSIEDRRAYWRQWYANNKHREDYKKKDRASKKRIRKERRDWYHNLKKELKCERCGINDFRVLDFHHTDPATKEIEVANLANSAAPKERILAEIAKCRVLCSNCHRIEHWEEKESLKVK